MLYVADLWSCLCCLFISYLSKKTLYILVHVGERCSRAELWLSTHHFNCSFVFPLKGVSMWTMRINRRTYSHYWSSYLGFCSIMYLSPSNMVVRHLKMKFTLQRVVGKLYLLVKWRLLAIRSWVVLLFLKGHCVVTLMLQGKKNNGRDLSLRMRWNVLSR